MTIFICRKTAFSFQQHNEASLSGATDFYTDLDDWYYTFLDLCPKPQFCNFFAVAAGQSRISPNKERKLIHLIYLCFQWLCSQFFLSLFKTIHARKFPLENIQRFGSFQRKRWANFSFNLSQAMAQIYYRFFCRYFCHDLFLLLFQNVTKLLRNQEI